MGVFFVVMRIGYLGICFQSHASVNSLTINSVVGWQNYRNGAALKQISAINERSTWSIDSESVICGARQVLTETLHARLGLSRLTMRNRSPTDTPVILNDSATYCFIEQFRFAFAGA